MTFIYFQPLPEIDLNLGELDFTSEDFLLDEVDGKKRIFMKEKPHCCENKVVFNQLWFL